MTDWTKGEWIKGVALAHYFDCQFAGDPRGLERALAVRDAISYPTEKPPPPQVNAEHQE